jgi:hypothetical protein
MLAQKAFLVISGKPEQIMWALALLIDTHGRHTPLRLIKGGKR